jgi:hypothetical protein
VPDRTLTFNQGDDLFEGGGWDAVQADHGYMLRMYSRVVLELTGSMIAPIRLSSAL